jgi:fructuronate reductase
MSGLPELRARGVQTPAYDRGKITDGVLHFGPGAFHRVHQACYFDALLHADARWGICEVALQSSHVRDALVPQEGLYTVAVLDSDIHYRVIGAAREFLVARDSGESVLRRFIQPTTHLVTATITEKGYCLSAEGGLDFRHEAIRHDLEHRETPQSFIGYVVEGLRRRRAAKLAPLNVVSCDNLSDNGVRLRRAVLEFARESDSDLAKWIEGEVAFPRTMVDSIAPATDVALRTSVARALGVADRWPVQREAFTQWIVEDTLRGVRPDLTGVGVIFADNVSAYEQAKLRLLNGAHSSLAYLGILAGYEQVSQAIGDPLIAAFIDEFMSEVKSTLTAPRGLDLDRYGASLLMRFRNPSLVHRLSQIAWDGSQKIPYRILGTIRDNLIAGRPIDHLCTAIAAWFYFLRRRALSNELPVDPLADELNERAVACRGDAAADVRLFLELDRVFPDDLTSVESFRTALIGAYCRLATLHATSRLSQPALGAA